MLQTVRDACQFDPKAIDYALSEQIESLDDLVGHDDSRAKAFFDKTYVTGGMKTLLRQGLQRLAGTSGQAVFEMKQAMGGGKTHSMLALGYLAANPSLSTMVAPDITNGFKPAKARVVAVSGRSISRDKHLWGDIAEQLGKATQFVQFYKGAPEAPNEKDWVEMIGDEPTLILLDELPPYFAYAISRQVGAGTLADVATYALSNLLSAALKLKHLCVVISNLSGSYQGASQQITTMVNRATANLQNEATRQGKPIIPVELGSDEIYHILRTRLLLSVPSATVVDSVASAFSEVISDAVKAKSVAKSAEQIADEIVASYPFHPSFKHILALFKDNERFRQTRGLMTLAAMMVRSVLDRKTNDVYLVGCQHLDLTLPDIREGVTNIYDLSGAIAHDIAGSGAERGHSQVIDEQMGRDSATQVAGLLLMASLPEASGAVKGLSRSQVIENLVAPHRTATEFDDAFEKLRADCWYLHRRENDAFVFERNENLRKKIEIYAERAPQPKIDAELKRRLESVFEARRKVAYQSVLALPKVSEIKTNGVRVLLVLSPDRRMPPDEAKKLFDAVVEKNNFCVVTGDGSDLAKLEDRVRRIWAVAKVREEDGGDKGPNAPELNEEVEHAEFEFNSTLTALFNRVYYPGKHPKDGETLLQVPLKMTPTKAKDGKPDAVDGEAAIEDALAATGASKLYKEIKDDNWDTFRTRAETMLWIGTDRRARWKDVEDRAISTVRWPWLPPKGLEDIRKRAISRGDWRDNNDGYVEKGPFPPAKTSVKAVTKNREDNGKATIEVTALNAGPKPRIHVAPTSDVSEASPTVADVVFESDSTVLWFLAVDPEGKCTTGDPEKWTNTLTLTHQPKEVMGKRTVTLDVKPRGSIRWNLDGTNVKEGKEYKGPIDIPGDKETVLYVYAEHAGVEIKKEFTIRESTGGVATIDKTKPAIVARKVKLATTVETFGVLKAARKNKGVFGKGLSITVGKGDKNATTRFGPGTSMSAEAIEAFITAARAAVGDDAAEAEIGFGEFSFATGADLEGFMEEASEFKIDPSEVQQ